MPAADVALWKRDATGAQGWHAKASAGSRAELCAEAGHFSIADSLDAVAGKLIRRHPHIFMPDGRLLAEAQEITAAQVKATWDEIKATERASEGKRERTLLGGLPRSLPAPRR